MHDILIPMKNALLLIDVQYDFCNPSGALFVPGSPDDCAAMAKFITENSSRIDAIFATLDTHSAYHIAHPLFWTDAAGSRPAPYTPITLESYRNGLWKPVDASLGAYVETYLTALEKQRKYTLLIWPPHCLIGSQGWTMDKTVYDAVSAWEQEKPGRIACCIEKGHHALTEHYSAVRAEVPVPGCPETDTNTKLIQDLQQYDRIYVAGEALSHCVANTVNDLLKSIPAGKFTLLSSCTSSVSGYEKQGESFIESWRAQGMSVE